MAALTLLDCFLYAHDRDFTVDTNAAKLAMDVAVKDKTTFASGGWKECLAGLRSTALAYAGFLSHGAGDVDVALDGALGVSNRVFTMGPDDVEGQPAYLFRAGNMSTAMFGDGIGEPAGFTVNASGTDGFGVVRGQLAKAKGNVSAVGALGSGLNLGAVAAGKYLYGSFHVFTPGTTITVVLESDDANTFATATTRATLGPITTAGGVWATRVAGSITDTWFRYRVTAITGTFSVAGAIGIG